MDLRFPRNHHRGICLRLGGILLAVCFCTAADTPAPVNSVVATVRAGMRKKHKDADVAFSLDKVTLSERLEDRVLEILESEGAGPQTLGILQQLRDDSRALPLPPGPPPGMEPPPPPSAVEERKVWQQARVKAMEYIQSLPDFICTETIHRWTDPTGNLAWQPAATIAAQLTFFEHQEHYKSVTIDGKPTDSELLEVDGAVSAGEFGTMLNVVFNPSSAADFHWDHWTTLRKQTASVYFFRIAASHSPHQMKFRVAGREGVTAIVGLHGFVYLDREDRVIRITQESEDIPADFPVQKASIVLDYSSADVGGRQFLLPLRAEVRLDAGKIQNLNTVQFQAYRKFGSDTTVNFGESMPDPPPVKKK